MQLLIPIILLFIISVFALIIYLPFHFLMKKAKIKEAPRFLLYLLINGYIAIIVSMFNIITEDTGDLLMLAIFALLPMVVYYYIVLPIMLINKANKVKHIQNKSKYHILVIKLSYLYSVLSLVSILILIFK